jgi:hypothetical protein
MRAFNDDRLPMWYSKFHFCCWAAIVMLAGCGSEGPFRYSRASGTLTYEDGTPIPAEYVTLIFVPQTSPQGSDHPRNGHAVVAADGSFAEVTTHRNGDGIVAGRHKVVIQATDDGVVPKPVIPNVFTFVTTTPLEVDSVDAPFAFKVPRP